MTSAATQPSAKARPASPQRSPTSAQPGFRSDINGLRAISVVAVILFHFDPAVAPGGFCGVDVFFVISGFLITRIIAGRLEAGGFRYGGFMAERARRILPALIAMCAVVLALGSVVLDPWADERLAGAIPPTLLFVSNIVYAFRTGYFSPAAASDWMTHTWSLSVEWQLYLVYPLLLAAVAGSPLLRRRQATVLFAATAVVFVLGLVAPGRWRSWEFYLAPTRSWEFLAGGACAFLETRLALARWGRLTLHLAGLSLIGVGVFVLSAQTSWPSPESALPVAGASFVLLAGVASPWWSDTAPVRWIGLSSYSAYLWHWPLALALRDWGVRFGALETAGGLAAALALGLASYLIVERRLTRWVAAFRPPFRLGAAAAGVALVGVAALAVAGTHGLEALRTSTLTPPLRASLADDRAARADWSFPAVCGRLAQAGPLSLCQLGAGRPDLVVLGDSQAEELAFRAARASRPGPSTLFVTSEGCPPLPGVGLGGSMHCPNWSAAAFTLAERTNARRIVIAAAWPAYGAFDPEQLAGNDCFVVGRACRPAGSKTARSEALAAAFARLQAEAARLRALGKGVILVGPAPRSEDFDPERLYRREFWSRAPAPALAPGPIEAAASSAGARLAAVARRAGANYVDPIPAICGAGGCPVTLDGRALYKDAGHVRASQMASPLFSYLDTPLGLARPER